MPPSSRRIIPISLTLLALLVFAVTPLPARAFLENVAPKAPLGTTFAPYQVGTLTGGAGGQTVAPLVTEAAGSNWLSRLGTVIKSPFTRLLGGPVVGIGSGMIYSTEAGAGSDTTNIPASAVARFPIPTPAARDPSVPEWASNLSAQQYYEKISAPCGEKQGWTCSEERQYGYYLSGGASIEPVSVPGPAPAPAASAQTTGSFESWLSTSPPSLSPAPTGAPGSFNAGVSSFIPASAPRPAVAPAFVGPPAPAPAAQAPKRVAPARVTPKPAQPSTGGTSATASIPGGSESECSLVAGEPCSPAQLKEYSETGQLTYGNSGWSGPIAAPSPGSDADAAFYSTTEMEAIRQGEFDSCNNAIYPDACKAQVMDKYGMSYTPTNPDASPDNWDLMGNPSSYGLAPAPVAPVRATEFVSGGIYDDGFLVWQRTGPTADYAPTFKTGWGWFDRVVLQIPESTPSAPAARQGPAPASNGFMKQDTQAQPSGIFTAQSADNYVAPVAPEGSQGLWTRISNLISPTPSPSARTQQDVPYVREGFTSVDNGQSSVMVQEGVNESDYEFGSSPEAYARLLEEANQSPPAGVTVTPLDPTPFTIQANPIDNQAQEAGTTWNFDADCSVSNEAAGLCGSSGFIFPGQSIIDSIGWTGSYYDVQTDRMEPYDFTDYNY